MKRAETIIAIKDARGVRSNRKWTKGRPKGEGFWELKREDGTTSFFEVDETFAAFLPLMDGWKIDDSEVTHYRLAFKVRD